MSARIVLRVTIVHERFGREVVLTASPTDLVRGVIDRVLAEAGITGEVIEWQLWDGPTPLPLNGTLNVLFAGRTSPIDLELRHDDSDESDEFELSLDASPEPRSVGVAPGSPAPSAPPAGDIFETDFEMPLMQDDSASEVVALDDEDDLDDVRDSAPAKQRRMDADEDDEDEAPARSRTTQKRATIRYYSRMNPDRVYPLRVLFTRDVVEKIVKQHVEQASTGPLPIATDTPVEIEPILPGCSCHPPKFSTFIDGPDQIITFHVVPHVLGAVSGARVLVRQNHGTIATIELDIRVVQRTWVVLSGLSTFAVPAASAAMRHFGLDFKPRDGFNPYLAAANVLFGQVHPVALTAALAAVTGVLYWFTRPKGRDTFWDVKTSGPAELLAGVEEDIFENPDEALAALRELLRAYPDYQPAWVVFGEWHYDHEEYEPALTGYQEAMRLGVLEPQHYRYASLAASRLKRNREALEILQRAESELPAGRMESVAFFNMACYHCRLGEPDAAMRCLHRAVAAGYRERKSYADDKDLAPLRNRADFRALLAGLSL